MWGSLNQAKLWEFIRYLHSESCWGLSKQRATLFVNIMVGSHQYFLVKINSQGTYFSLKIAKNGNFHVPTLAASHPQAHPDQMSQHLGFGQTHSQKQHATFRTELSSIGTPLEGKLCWTAHKKNCSAWDLNPSRLLSGSFAPTTIMAEVPSDLMNQPLNVLGHHFRPWNKVVGRSCRGSGGVVEGFGWVWRGL